MPEATEENHSTPLQSDDIARIERSFNLRHIGTGEGFLIFDSQERNGARQREAAIPLDVASEILEAIDRGAERMEEYEGWIDPQRGLAEFEVRQQGLTAFRSATIDKFTFELHPCAHAHVSDPPFMYDEDGNHVSTVIRVTSNDGSTCIEISPNSALCLPLMPVDTEDRGHTRTQTTLKVHLSGTTEKADLVRRSRELANSFLFELNVRHRCPYSLRPRVEGPSQRRHDTAIDYTVRFPKTPIPDNIASLFSIPSDFAMRGNRTLFYLSYYQILEHYLPAVHKRETVRKVRRVLRSLDFDEEKDSSVLKILNSVERSHGASEGEQLRTLIEECVSESRLQEFLSLDHGGHFGKNGPISGVPAIHPKSGESLASQVAKRIYMLRNRIVHAKDDARYAESKVLLPLSHEALRLHPDIELVRLLAIEVIVDNR
ncbi:hypothetical protein [Streptomyces sp. NBC_00316]|uniref:hypothetical protein n=1 Tax=Streptomyces sp. NBC_00316 TaxID=2975710 RepID=UPI002E292879|nr:hypothetical protein [Streptomyces sp. NBC_00316]